jgi:hypothetical protein
MAFKKNWNSDAGAKLSEDGVFRYLLWRGTWQATAANGTCLFVMLNPSTADASKDDPTIRKCIAFADRWGFLRIEVVNLYAFRSSSPKALKSAGYPVGPDNDREIAEAVKRARRVCLAWGNNAQPERADVVTKLVAQARSERSETCALHLNADGSPAHPLYQRNDAQIILFPKGAPPCTS